MEYTKTEMNKLIHVSKSLQRIHGNVAPVALIPAARVMLPFFDYPPDVVNSISIGHITMPFAVDGDLSMHLDAVYNKKRPMFTLLEILTIAHDIVQGVVTLKNAGLIHFDLKPKNILVTGIHAETNRIQSCALTDLGSSENHFTRSPIPAQVYGYGAPEVTSPHSEPLTSAVDMYSLGTNLLLIITADIDSNDIDHKQFMNPFVQKSFMSSTLFTNLQTRFGQDSMKVWILQIIAKCWRTEAHQRPPPELLASKLSEAKNIVLGRR